MYYAKEGLMPQLIPDTINCRARKLPGIKRDFM